MPDLSKASPTPRMPAVPSRESSLEPRPVGLSPSSPALAAHTLDEDSPAYGNMSRAGDSKTGDLAPAPPPMSHAPLADVGILSVGH